MSRSVIVTSFVTLDGVIQGPGGPEEDPRDGFTHGGWAAAYWDESLGDWMAPYYTGRPADLLLGRRTYELFDAHWRYVTDDPMADSINAARKYVASTTLKEVDWHNATLLEGDVAEAVAALKAEDGPEIQVHGSAGLTQTLLRHDLVDELRVMTFPLVIGSGRRLFGEGTIPVGLEVVDSAVTARGVVAVVYRRTGPVDHGSFALETPTDAELTRRQALAAES